MHNDSVDNLALTDLGLTGTEYCVYDDTATLWSAYGGGGGGAFGATVADHAVTVKSGAKSISVALEAGATADAGAKYTFGGNQDWSGWKWLKFWYYGANSGKVLRVYLYCVDAANSYSYSFTDDRAGWRWLEVPLTNLTTNAGAPNIATVKVIVVALLAVAAADTFYVDRMVVTTELGTELLSIAVPANTNKFIEFNPSIPMKTTMRVGLVSGAAKITVNYAPS